MGFLIRNRNQTARAPAMVQIQEETKEEVERVSLLKENKKEIHVPGGEIDEEITKERKKIEKKKFIYLRRIQRKEL